MKKLFLKIVSLFVGAALALSAAGCNAFFESLDNVLNRLSEELEKVIAGVSYIIDNFNDLTNPVSENGTPSEEWVGTDLEPLFVQPEGVTEFVLGYSEENERGRTYSNLVVVSGAADVVKFIEDLHEAGYDEFNEGLNWTFFRTMVISDSGKLCMALKKGDIYIQVAYFASESTSAPASTDGEDSEGDAENTESVEPTDSTDSESAEDTEPRVTGTPNAVFTIANYDITVRSAAANEQSEDPEPGQTEDPTESEQSDPE